MFAPPRRCVYTVLYGALDRLPPLDGAGMAAIAFVEPDFPPGEANGWTLRHLPPRLPGDPVRSARFAKLHPHLLLPDFNESLYIDCTVRLRQPPRALFAALLDGHAAPLACPAHSHRTSVLDEVRAVLALGYDDPALIRRQVAAYAALGLSGTGPLAWCGLLLRRHHDAKLARFSALWWEQVLRFSRRDQIALPFLAEQEGFFPHLHALDNEESPFHVWPVPRERVRALWAVERPADGAPGVLALLAELDARTSPL